MRLRCWRPASDARSFSSPRAIATILGSFIRAARVVWAWTPTWCDDVHHALWATLSGERQGYYCDFGSLPVLAKALNQGFVHDGGWSTFRGRSHGRPPTGVSAAQFVAYLQDHDQIGNRALGDRAAATLSDGLLAAGAALLLLSPFNPMLFMGEEWGARTPWQFFSDHDAELGRAVSEGRRREFASFGWSAQDIPDPQSLATFQDSKLDWSEAQTSARAVAAGLEPAADRAASLRAGAGRAGAGQGPVLLRRGSPLVRRHSRRHRRGGESGAECPRWYPSPARSCCRPRLISVATGDGSLMAAESVVVVRLS